MIFCNSLAPPTPMIIVLPVFGVYDQVRNAVEIPAKNYVPLTTEVTRQLLGQQALSISRVVWRIAIVGYT